MKVLHGYLLRRVGMQVLGVLALLAGMMQVLDLMDVTTDVLDRQLGVAGLLRYAVLRLPSEATLALPLSVLLGSMSAFYLMARNHEIVAIRSAGYSLMRILRVLLPLPVVLAVAQFAISDHVVPASENALKTWWDAHAPADQNPRAVWVQTAEGPVAFDWASPDGTRLRGLRIYPRDARHLPAARIAAREAVWTKGRWHLEQVETLRLDHATPQRTVQAGIVWQGQLRPADVMQLDLARPRLSSMTLIDVIAGERPATQPLSYYRMSLYHAFAAPLAPFVMLLLALPPARMLTRGGGSDAGKLVGVGLGLGLAYLLCDGILAALGASGRIPALAAALAAPLFFIALGFTLARILDRT